MVGLWWLPVAFLGKIYIYNSCFDFVETKVIQTIVNKIQWTFLVVKRCWNLQEAQRELAAERASSEKAREQRVSSVALHCMTCSKLSFELTVTVQVGLKTQCVAIRCQRNSGTTRTQPTKRRVLHSDSDFRCGLKQLWNMVGRHEIWLRFDSLHRGDMVLLYSFVQISVPKAPDRGKRGKPP
jgi:hypothetical protein